MFSIPKPYSVRPVDIVDKRLSVAHHQTSMLLIRYRFSTLPLLCRNLRPVILPLSENPAGALFPAHSPHLYIFEIRDLRMREHTPYPSLRHPATMAAETLTERWRHLVKFSPRAFRAVLESPSPTCAICGLRLAYTGTAFYCAEEDLHALTPGERGDQ